MSEISIQKSGTLQMPGVSILFGLGLRSER